MKNIISRTHHTNKPPRHCAVCCNFFTAKRGRPLSDQKYCSRLCQANGNVKSLLDAKDTFTKSFIVDPVSGCWNWAGYRASFGYGKIQFDRKTVRAHRFSYEIHIGPIPAGMIVRHTCDNPPCVNPSHLLVGTMKDNTKDMILRGRDKFRSGGELKGAAHPLSKITSEIAQEIFDAVGRHSDIAKRFNVSASLVGGIKRGTHWKHFTNRT